MFGESVFVDVTVKEAHFVVALGCLGPDCRVKEENKKT